MKNKLSLLIILAIFCISLFAIKPNEFLDNKSILAISFTILTISILISNVIPIGIASMLPLILFPLFNIIEFKEITSYYLSPISFLLIGGFFLAHGVYKYNIHQKISIVIINIFGINPRNIILSFTICSFILSMFISNTASCLILITIAISMIKFLEEEDCKMPIFINKKSKNNFKLLSIISIAYSANIGGISTLIGTPTNAILAGFLIENYNIDLTFIDWLIFAFPLSLTLVIISYLFLAYIAFPVKINHMNLAKSELAEKLQKEYNINNFDNNQKKILIILLFTILLWIFRKYINLLIPNLNDSIIALLGVILLFSLPKSNNKKDSKITMLMEKDDIKKISWDIILLLGYGVVISKILITYNISNYIEHILLDLNINNIFILTIILSFIIIILTEIMTNMVIITIFLPIFSNLIFNLNSELFMISLYLITISSSLAFMLPMATPPNAIAFSESNIKISTMIKIGAFMNIVSIIIISLYLNINSI